ncbi:uncharacterized protein LOC119322205 [Triticum dicoccoides]|uniref:uncharacterized protein LOC119322205 n=1 Tax=Triticum dicoccoides TaxID=85692 RepID=UPI001891766E|nr:uncharacterized protein LOC119322205 [Triticum dicoccoides]
MAAPPRRHQPSRSGVAASTRGPPVPVVLGATPIPRHHPLVVGSPEPAKKSAVPRRGSWAEKHSGAGYAGVIASPKVVRPIALNFEERTPVKERPSPAQSSASRRGPSPLMNIASERASGRACIGNSGHAARRMIYYPTEGKEEAAGERGTATALDSPGTSAPPELSFLSIFVHYYLKETVLDSSSRNCTMEGRVSDSGKFHVALKGRNDILIVVQ